MSHERGGGSQCAREREAAAGAEGVLRRRRALEVSERVPAKGTW